MEFWKQGPVRQQTRRHARNRTLWGTLVAALVALAAATAGAADPPDRAQAEQAIRAAAQQYVKALESGDVETLLGMWAEGGDIVDESGRAVPAQDAIRQDAAARVAAAGKQDGPPPETKVVDTSIRFVTPDVALEDGTVEVNGVGDGPQSGRFTAVWVKQNDRWLLASLREVRLNAAAHSKLEDLDAMVGTWKGEAGGATFDVTARWNEAHTYLLRDLTVTLDGKTVVNGEQRIGIDPLDGQIKSWMHDAAGGHGEGIWTHHGDTWVVQASGVTADGRRTTGTNLYRFDGKDHCIWKSLGATSGGQQMPDFEINLNRTSAGETPKPSNP